MSEAVFPLVGPLLVFAFVLPLSAVVAKLLLVLLGRLDFAYEQAAHGLRYLILVASSAAPILWFVSSSLHQAEDGQSALVCAVEHGAEAFCAEAAYFSLALCLLVAAFALPRVLADQLPLRLPASAGARAAQQRVDACVERHRSLAALAGRVFVTDVAPAPIATLGIFSPRVLLHTGFVQAVDDQALAAALHHELEHFRGLDPLRYFVAWWALAVNPLGRRLLGAEHSRWLFQRELVCDRQAVAAGASATALAHALVVAARSAHPAEVVALGACRVESIKLRLELLLAYADRPPARGRPDTSLRLLVAALVFAFALPHQSGTQALDTLHQASETAAFLLIGG